MSKQGLLPLVLSAKSKNWRSDNGMDQEADVEFRSVRKKALDRDNYTCRFCGFTCRPSRNPGRWGNFYMQVHHKDDDHRNNELNNLVTACMHCHACQHIGLYGQRKEAVLVWLPEITQADLNHLQRVIIVAKHYQKTAGALPADKRLLATEIADAADSIESAILMRKQAAEDNFGTSKPDNLANVLISDQMPPEAYQSRHRTFRGLRLMLTGKHNVGPECDDVMVPIVTGWMEDGGPFQANKPATWASLLKAMPA